MQLPAYSARRALLDLSPLTEAVDNWGKQQNAAAELGLQNRRQSLAEKDRDEAQKLKQVQRLAGIAKAIDDDTDPTRKAAAWQRVIARHPQLDTLDEAFRDPVRGPKLLMAEAGQYDPTGDELKRAQIERLRRDDTKYAAGQNFVYNTRTGDVTPLPQEARKDGPLETAVAKESVEMASNDIKAAYGAQDVRSSAEKLRGYATDKRLEAAIGPIAGTSVYQTIVGGLVPFSKTIGLAAPDLNRNIEQVKSSIVLAAQQKLKGLGPASDADSARIEKAVGLLERARSKKEFLDAVAEIDRSVEATLQRGALAARQFPQLGARLDAAQPRQTPQISQEQAMSEARDAIARGAPRDAVLKRLYEMGINTDGM